MGKPVAPCVGPGMVVRRVVVASRDVVFVKGIVEALEGLAQVFAEHGGDLTIAAPSDRAEELDALVDDLCAELGMMSVTAARRREGAMSFDVDIAIVGGGPAGTSTALHLARAEGSLPERVAIFDKAIHPREKPCAGAVSGWGLDALARIGVPLDVPHVTMRGLRVLDGEDGGASAWGGTGAREAGLGVVVRRSELDASLWRRAAGDGVRAHDGEALVDLARVPGGWEIVTTKRSLRAQLVAACDGAGSTVRKRLGLPEAARKGHLYVLETAPTDRDAGPRAGLCDFDMTPCAWGIEGYYWDFPTVIAGAPHVSRGIYHANFTPRSDVKAILGRALAARGIDIDAVKLKPFSTRPFVEGSLLAIDRLALVGEAAGIDATTGEGIAQAILFGAIAAHHLAQAIRLGSGRLDGYARDVRRARVGRHLLQSAWLARVVYGPRGAAWRRFLARSDGRARRGDALVRGGASLVGEEGGARGGPGAGALSLTGSDQKAPLFRSESSSSPRRSARGESSASSRPRRARCRARGRSRAAAGATRGSRSCRARSCDRGSGACRARSCARARRADRRGAAPRR